MSKIQAQIYINSLIKLDKSRTTDGDKITFTVTPNEHYVVKSGSIKMNAGAIDVTDKGNGTYEFTMQS